MRSIGRGRDVVMLLREGVVHGRAAGCTRMAQVWKQEDALLFSQGSKRKVDGCAASLLARGNRRAYSRNKRWTASSGSAPARKSRRRSSSSITQMADNSRYRTPCHSD